MVHALIPGSFDPVTRGHVDVIKRAAALFDQVTVAIVVNPNKSGLFSIEERQSLIHAALSGELPNVTTDTISGLLAHYARDHGISVLIKGLRSTDDFAYELPMDHMNRHLTGVSTVYLATAAEYSFVSSSLVREVAKLGGDISEFVPEPVAQALQAKLGH